MVSNPALNQLTKQCGEWLRGSGPESDIVISSRIRLARNLANYPFIRRCTDHDRTAIEATISEKFKSNDTLSKLVYLNVEDLEQVDRQFLVERQLISREHGRTRKVLGRLRSIWTEQFSLMVNEEDHLRIQLMKSGLDLDRSMEANRTISTTVIESVVVPYAFHDRLGYLTACPTNVGTGMRVSVMLHLAGFSYHPANRKGFSKPTKNQSGRPRTVWRGFPGNG